jgi:hypothetical protein
MSEERSVSDPGQSSPTEPEPESPHSTDRGIAGFVTGMLIGALVGAGVALLFAPARGDRLRRRLGRGARHLGDRARHGIEHAARRARRGIDRYS